MTALYFAGLLVLVVSGIWLLVVAFQTSVLWGLLSLLVPFASLVFVIIHWQVAKKPFLWQLLGVAMVVVALVSSPSLLHMSS